MNASCSDAVTDGGWYECPTPLTGDIISIQRTSGATNIQNIMTLRAYSGLNVAQAPLATVESEPTPNGGQGANNLLRTGYRTVDYQRSPFEPDGAGGIVVSSHKSCAEYTGQSGLTTVVTLKLDTIYLVDAILIMGDYRTANHLSEFHLYVGNDSDYTNNV